MVATADGASSDDEDYNAVDLISDSDENDSAVERAEERDIVGFEDRETLGPYDGANQNQPPAKPTIAAPSNGDGADGGDGDSDDEAEDGQEEKEAGGNDADDESPGNVSDDNADDEQEEDEEEEALANVHGDATLADDHESAVINPYFTSEMESFALAVTLDRAKSEPAADLKRVRFLEQVSISDCSNSADDDERHGFPGPFMPQEYLDPSFMDLIENDDGDDGCFDAQASNTAADDLNSGDASFDEFPLEPMMDEGDTTDDDLPPPQSIARTRSVLRRLSMSSSTSDSDSLCGRTSLGHARGGTSKRRGFGPSLACWIRDMSKPAAVIDPSGMRLRVYPAKCPPPQACAMLDTPEGGSGNSSANSSPRVSQAPILTTPGSVFSDLASPTIGVGTDTGMRRILRSGSVDELLLTGPLFGLQETPLGTASSAGVKRPFLSYDYDDYDLDDDDDVDDKHEMMLNVLDFVDLGAGSSDAEEEGGGGDGGNNSERAAAQEAEEREWMQQHQQQQHQQRKKTTGQGKRRMSGSAGRRSGGFGEKAWMANGHKRLKSC